jgi:hypothetical protein
MLTLDKHNNTWLFYIVCSTLGKPSINNANEPFCMFGLYDSISSFFDMMGYHHYYCLLGKNKEK